MKNYILTVAILLGGLFAACSSDSEYHQISFSSNSVTMYADQEIDSVYLYYSDAWTATLSDQSWLSVSPTSGTMEKTAMLMVTPLIFTAQPNTSGKLRYVNLNISSHEKGGITITQLPVLNIAFPYYAFREGTEISSDNIYYAVRYYADATDGNIIFTIYRDNATLTTDATWLTLSETEFEAGKHDVAFTMQPNATGKARTATVTLTSGGVSVPITIEQLAADN